MLHSPPAGTALDSDLVVITPALEAAGPLPLAALAKAMDRGQR